MLSESYFMNSPRRRPDLRVREFLLSNWHAMPHTWTTYSSTISYLFSSLKTNFRLGEKEKSGKKYMNHGPKIKWRIGAQHLVETLKISLSQKEILLSLILPKNELEKFNFCPSLLGQNFFVIFLEEWKNKSKSPFEINWSLVISFVRPSLRFSGVHCISYSYPPGTCPLGLHFRAFKTSFVYFL